MKQSRALLLFCCAAAAAASWFPHIDLPSASWAGTFGAWVPSSDTQCRVLFRGDSALSYVRVNHTSALPATLIVALQPGRAEPQLRMDVRFVDGTGMYDIRDDDLGADCLAVPPHKPIRYLVVHATAPIVVYALTENSAGAVAPVVFGEDEPGNNKGAVCDKDVDFARLAGRCMVARPPVSFELPTHPFFLSASTLPDPDDVSLYTMLSTDRLVRLEEMSRFWPGSVSAAVVVTSIEEIPELVRFWMSHEHMRKHVDIHLVYDDQVPLMVLSDRPFPANYLRNVGLRNCRTNLVFYMEADFVPSRDLYESLVPAKKYLLNGVKAVFVVASFIASEGVTADEIPPNKAALIEYLDGKNEIKKMPYGSHKAFKLDTWKTATDIYQLPMKNGFEPYYVGLRSYPLFDEHFYGCGRDKVEHMQEIMSLGYNVYALPQGFIIHLSSEGMGAHWCEGWTKHYRTAIKKLVFMRRIKETPGLLNNVRYIDWWDAATLARVAGHQAPAYDLPPLPENTVAPARIVAEGPMADNTAPDEFEVPAAEQPPTPPEPQAQPFAEQPLPREQPPQKPDPEEHEQQQQPPHALAEARNLAKQIREQREIIRMLERQQASSILACCASIMAAMFFGGLAIFFYRQKQKTL